MERRAFHILIVFTVLILTIVWLNAHPVVAAESDDDQRSLIAPLARGQRARPTAAGRPSGGNGRSGFRPP